MFVSKIAIAAIAVGLAAGSVPAGAVITTFANYSGVGGANLYWKNAGTGGSLYTIATPTSKVAGSVSTKFTFLSPAANNPLTFLANLGALDATFTFSATAAPGTPVVSAAGYDIQPLTSGSFSFIYTGTADLVVHNTTYHTGADLLTATFTGGGIVGADKSTSGAIGAATTSGNTIVYTSDFLNFVPTRDKDFSISASAITPKLGFTAGKALKSFSGTTTGSFSTDPQPVLTAVVPEPAVWGLMIVGFGLIGVSARRRGNSVAA